MADVFISFIHEEEPVAVGVQTFLQEALFSRDRSKVFLSADKWKVFAGEVWLDRIKHELKSAQIVILMLSQSSVKRPWVNFEAGAAWLNDKVIIPVCYGALSKDRLPKPYSGIQAVYLGGEGFPDEAYYLLTSVAHGIQPLILSPPPPPAFFLKWNPSAEEQSYIQQELDDGSLPKSLAPYKELSRVVKEFEAAEGQCSSSHA